MLTLPPEEFIYFGLGIFSCCQTPILISCILNVTLICKKRKAFHNQVLPMHSSVNESNNQEGKPVALNVGKPYFGNYWLIRFCLLWRPNFTLVHAPLQTQSPHCKHKVRKAPSCVLMYVLISVLYLSQQYWEQLASCEPIRYSQYEIDLWWPVYSRTL